MNGYIGAVGQPTMAINCAVQ